MGSNNSDREQSLKVVGAGAPSTAAPRPEWADGLRELYESVVDEPLPDSFKDLLDKLDDGSSDGLS